MKIKRDVENVFLVIIAVIAIAVLISLIGSNYTGLVIYNNELNLDNNSNYISESMDFSNSEVKLASYILIENVTNESDYNYYLDEAEYDRDDVTELVKENDDQSLIMNKNDRLEFELENKNFKNNQIIALHILNGSEYIYLCKSKGNCNINGTNFIGGIFVNNDGFYNITIKLEDEKKKIYLVADNIRLDYIYMIERNISSSLIEKTKYYENGYIETNFSINDLNNFNYISADYVLNSQSIGFYYMNNDSWQEFFLGNISLTNSRIKIFFNSDTSSTPILYNITLSYNLICYENWSCSEWSNCTNGNKTRTCGDDNECETLIEKPNEIENCNETITETPSSTSSGSGGGGGSSGGTKITPTETRILEQTQVPVKTEENDNLRTLEKKIDTCKDGIKNNGETKVDCGGPCIKCTSIISILPYSNYMLFVLLLLTIITILNKGRFGTAER